MSLENALTQIREDLAAIVGSKVITIGGVTKNAVTITDADGVTPIDAPIELVAPNPITPPCIITGPDGPYIEFGEINFGEKKLNLMVILAAPAGENDISAAQLDEMLVDVLPRLLSAEPTFCVDQVDQPAKVGLNGSVFLGVVIRLHTFSTLA